MKTLEEIAMYCVQDAVKNGALFRSNDAGNRASQAPAFLGPTSPLDGDLEHLRAEIDAAGEHGLEHVDDDEPHGIARETARVFSEAYETEMTRRMSEQTETEFPFQINTAKSDDRFVTIEAAAEWLAQLQPSFCGVNGWDFDWDPETDEDEMVEVIATAIRNTLRAKAAFELNLCDDDPIILAMYQPKR